MLCQVCDWQSRHRKGQKVNASLCSLASQPRSHADLANQQWLCTHYFDAKTGTEHIWGIGHMAMKPSASSEGLKAVGRRTDVVGISIGKLQEDIHLELGWGSRQRIDIVDEGTQLCLG